MTFLAHGLHTTCGFSTPPESATESRPALSAQVLSATGSPAKLGGDITRKIFEQLLGFLKVSDCTCSRSPQCEFECELQPKARPCMLSWPSVEIPTLCFGLFRGAAASQQAPCSMRSRPWAMCACVATS